MDKLSGLLKKLKVHRYLIDGYVLVCIDVLKSFLDLELGSDISKFHCLWFCINLAILNLIFWSFC